MSCVWRGVVCADPHAVVFRPLEDIGHREQEPPGVTSGPGLGSWAGVGVRCAVCHFVASENRSLVCECHSDRLPVLQEHSSPACSR